MIPPGVNNIFGDFRRLVTADEQGNLKRAAMRLGVTERTLQLRRAAQKADLGQAGNGALPADGGEAGAG